MHESRPLTCVVSQFALACNLTTFFYLMTTTEGIPYRFFPQSMLVYAPLLYLVNRLFLRQERTMLALSLLNGFLGGAMLVGCLLLEPWRSFSHLAFTAVFLAWLTIRGCRFALDGPTLQSTLLMLDASVVLLVLFMGYSAVEGLGFHWSIPALCGLSASVLAASSSRSAQPWSPKGWLAVGGAFGVLVLLMSLFVGVAAVPAGQGLVALWSLFLALLNGIKNLLARLILFLFSLLPPPDSEGMAWYEPLEISMEEELAAAETSPVGEIILLILAILAAAAALVWLVRCLGRIRLQRAGKEVTFVKPRRERPSLLKGFLKLISGWVSGLRLRVALWRGRNTAAGLYSLLVHRCRRAPWHKRIGETPREFLLRLAGFAGADEQLRAALEQLAGETDAALYSGHPGRAVLDYAPLVRRRIGSAVRTHFLRDLAARLRPAR